MRVRALRVATELYLRPEDLNVSAGSSRVSPLPQVLSSMGGTPGLSFACLGGLGNGGWRGSLRLRSVRPHCGVTVWANSEGDCQPRREGGVRCCSPNAKPQALRGRVRSWSACRARCSASRLRSSAKVGMASEVKSMPLWLTTVPAFRGPRTAWPVPAPPVRQTGTCRRLGRGILPCSRRPRS